MTGGGQAPSRAGLDYPFRETPPDGGAFEVAPGVLWIRMPLPFALTHINLWAIADGEGWAVIDTGLHSDAAIDIWRTLLADALMGRPVTRVIVTHMHPDHVGMAGWLVRHTGCRLWMSRLEYLTCRALNTEAHGEPPPESIDFYRRAGWKDEAAGVYRTLIGSFGTDIHPLPASYRRVTDGERLAIGGREWQVITGNGHSPEHVCLYCPALKLLISGDQVLPRISSNISVYPVEPDADPLGDWLASISKLKRQVPDDVLVLPAHNECFRGLHARLDRLATDHESGLAAMRDLLREPRRAVDVFPALFARAVDGPHLKMMATGEALAHLNYLVHRGEVAAGTDADGTFRYRLAA